MAADVTLTGYTLADYVMRHERCVLLVRHGRTSWNVADRLTTRSNPPLDDVGETQGRAVGLSLQGAVFDRAFASPKRRAWRTAELSLTGLDGAPTIVADDRLVEPDAGPVEGECFDDLYNGAHAEAFAAYCRETSPVFPAGCETIEQSAGRARAFLDEVCALPGRTFVASHGAFLRILTCVFLGQDAAGYRRLKLDNCHGVLLKLYPQGPHQLAAFNLPPLPA